MTDLQMAAQIKRFLGCRMNFNIKGYIQNYGKFYKKTKQV